MMELDIVKCEVTNTTWIMKERKNVSARTQTVLCFSSSSCCKYTSRENMLHARKTFSRMQEVKDFLNKEFERTLNVTS